MKLRTLISGCSAIILCSLLLACGGNDSNDDHAAATKNVAVNAIVVSTDNAFLYDTAVTVGNKTVTTGKDGSVTFNATIAKDSQEVPISFKKEGFITQSFLVKPEELKLVTATLLKIKTSQKIDKIEQAQTIKADLLGATISIPDNAFVTADGTAATGAATVAITPWNIDSTDLTAMPANGQALGSNGERVQLISAGMLTSVFFDAQGKELQLAADKTATIEMDLPFASINGQKMEHGSEIPLWYFDSKQGLWLEEGVGEVIADNATNSLKVSAKVKHFTTWNWDFKLSGDKELFVQCKQLGQPVECAVTATISLTDNSKVTKKTYIGKAGTTVINLPTNYNQISWQAYGSSDSGKHISTAVDSSVTINLTKEYSHENFVSCIDKDSLAVACTVSIENASGYYRIVDVPKGGATVKNSSGASNFTWTIVIKDSSNQLIDTDCIIASDPVTPTSDSEPIVLKLKPELWNDCLR